MADEAPKPAPDTGSEMIKGPDQIVEAIGKSEGLSPDLIRKAQEKFRDLNKSALVRATRDKLTELAKNVSTNDKLTKTDQDTIDRVIVIALRAGELDRFEQEVLRAGHDFIGDDSSDEETLKNPIFGKAREQIEGVYANVPPNVPVDFYKEWIGLATDVLVTEIASWKGVLEAKGRMDIKNVDAAINKIYDRSKGGIGTFEEWFKITHISEFDAWQKTKAENAAKQAETTKQKANMDAARGKTTAKVPDLEKRLLAIPATVLPATLNQRMTDLKANIGTAPDAAKLADHEKALADISVQLDELEKIKAHAENTNFPNAARRDEILAAVREGKQTPLDARTELDALAKTEPPEPASTEAQGTAAKLLGISSEEGTLDWLKRKAEEAAPGSKWKTILTAISGLFLGLAVKLSGLPIVGDWVRGGLVSNETLDKLGDPQAKLYLALEGKLKKFGIPKKLANKIGKMKLKDFVAKAKAKPDDFSKDQAVKERLAQFVAQVEARGASAAEASLLEFINSPAGTNIAPQAAPAPAAAPTTPPPAPATPPAAPAAPAAPTPPAATPTAAQPPEQPKK